MNDRELQVKQQYEEKGWKVLRNGAPDFLMFKTLESTNATYDVLMVEVKSTKDRLSYEQSIYREIMEQHGIPFKVEVIQ